MAKGKSQDPDSVNTSGDFLLHLVKTNTYFLDNFLSYKTKNNSFLKKKFDDHVNWWPQAVELD